MIRKILRFLSNLFFTVVFFMAFVSFYAYVRSFYVAEDTDLQAHLTETECSYLIFNEDTPVILDDITYELADARICRERIHGNLDEIHFTDEELSKPIIYYNGNLKVTEPYQYIWISMRVRNHSDSIIEFSPEKSIISLLSNQQIVEIPAEIRYRSYDSTSVPPDGYEYLVIGYLVDETSFSETKLYYPLMDELFFYLGEIER